MQCLKLILLPHLATSIDSAAHFEKISPSILQICRRRCHLNPLHSVLQVSSVGSRDVTKCWHRVDIDAELWLRWRVVEAIVGEKIIFSDMNSS